MATIAPKSDRISRDGITGEEVTVSAYRQYPVLKQRRQGGK
jgi:hypothetical protein